MTGCRKLFGSLLRTILALVCAYFVVVQAALGGFSSVGHLAAAIENPFAVICLNGLDSDGADAGQGEADHRGCCTLGCAPPAAAPPSAPEPQAFAYDPRPTPRRSAEERAAAPQADVLQALKRPRGPPATI